MDALTRLRRSLIGGDDEEQPEDSILGDTEDLCSLSPLQVRQPPPQNLRNAPRISPGSPKPDSFVVCLAQRVYAFAICLVVGLTLMILVRLGNSFPIRHMV
jgi:hypothetical protein